MSNRRKIRRAMSEIHYVGEYDIHHDICEHGHATVGVFFYGADGKNYVGVLPVSMARNLAESISRETEAVTAELMAAEAA